MKNDISHLKCNSLVLDSSAPKTNKSEGLYLPKLVPVPHLHLTVNLDEEPH